MSNKVTLYIATHNVTGLKYFGKTTRYFTEESLQEKYHGSGTYWKRHLKKHSDDVTMEIYKVCSLDNVQKIALEFSKEYNIKESSDWANMRDEDGLRGGNLSEETKAKIGKSNKIALTGREQTELHKRNTGNAQIGKKRSKEAKKKMSDAKIGKKFSKEHKEKLSIAAKNKPKVSDATRLKLSIAAKKQWAKQKLK